MASIADDAYAAAGASVGNRTATLAGADILLGVQGPDPDSLGGAAAGAWIVAGLNPFGERARVVVRLAQPQYGRAEAQTGGGIEQACVIVVETTHGCAGQIAAHRRACTG